METQQVTVPANSIRLFLPLQLLTIINAKSGSENQLSATWILKVLTVTLKDDIIKNYGQQTYDSLLRKYSLTAQAQAQANIEKKEERQRKREERFKLEKDKLRLKKEELQIRKGNKTNREEKKKEEEEREEIDYRLSVLQNINALKGGHIDFSAYKDISTPELERILEELKHEKGVS